MLLGKMERPICGRQIGRSTHDEIIQRGMSSEDYHSMMRDQELHTHFSKNVNGNIWKKSERA